MKLSIIVASVDNKFYLERTLDSVFMNVSVPFEIILVDDGSTLPETFTYYEKIRDKVKLVFNETNQGYIKSVNKGLALADGGLILLLNDDLLIPQNSVENMIKHLLSDKSLGMVSCLSNNSIPLPSERLPPGYNIEEIKSFYSWVYQLQARNRDELLYYYSLEGFALLFTKEFYQKIKLEEGLYDERFEIGNYEDRDLSRRAVRAGYRLGIALDSYIHHFTHATFKKDLKRYYYLLDKNENIFREKWDRPQKITAMLAIKNEEKYIGRVLEHLSLYVDSIAILDDASTDNTVEIVKKFPKVKKLHINPPGLERHEGRDRNLLFRLAKELNPDWFLCLDGDEIFEDKIITEIQKLCNPVSDLIDGYSFPIFHFWRGETHYRVDKPWGKQGRFKLFRNRTEYTEFNQLKINASSVPLGINHDFLQFSPIRIKHYGFADYNRVVEKYHFYEKNDDVKNPVLVGGKDYSYFIDESGIELLEWEENRKEKYELSVAVYVNESNKHHLKQTLDSLCQYQELIIVNASGKEPIHDIPVDARILGINLTFEESREIVFKQARKDFILFIKAGEFLSYENRIRITDHICKTGYKSSRLLISYIDPLYPYASFIETRIFKSSSISCDEPVQPPIAEIYSGNSLKAEKLAFPGLLNLNVDNFIAYNKKDPENFNSLYYLGLSLTLNREWKTSLKVLEKYLTLPGNRTQKLRAMLYQAINCFFLKDNPKSISILNEVLVSDKSNLESRIWLNFNYLKLNRLNAACHQLSFNGKEKNTMAEKILYQEYKNLAVQQKKEIIRQLKAINKKEYPELTVIIPTYNNLNYLKRTLESLYYSTNLFMRVIIVDDGSMASDIKDYLSENDFFEVITIPENKGYINAVNTAIVKVNTELILLLNNDVYLTYQAIDKMAEVLLHQTEIAAVGPLSNYALSEQAIKLDYKTNSELEKILEKIPASVMNYKTVNYLSGFCLMLKNEAVKVLLKDGYFLDPAFGDGYYEDGDLSERMRRAGYKLAVVKSAYVHHYGSRTFGEIKKVQAETVNKKVFFSKWSQKPVVTAMLAIKNEERYIGMVLDHLSEYVDSIAVLDDASTDSTVEIVRKFPKVKKLHINRPGIGRHEGRDRNLLFGLAKELNPQWFLCLDGDEVFEERMRKEIDRLCSNPEVEGYAFIMYHLWRSRNFYRVDGIWKNQARLKLFRNREIYTSFENNKLHVPTVPVNLPFDKVAVSDIRLKHYGYAEFKDTVKKYEFYEKEDTEKRTQLIGRENYSHLVDESGIELEEWFD